MTDPLPDVHVPGVDNDALFSATVRTAMAGTFLDPASPEGVALRTRTFNVDTGYASLDAAFADTPAGGVLEVRQAWSKVLPLNVDKAITLRFRGGSIAVTVATAYAIVVAANNVRLDGPVLTGTGSATSSTGAGIYAVGTSLAGAPITGLRISRPTISSFSQHGIYLENCSDFRVEDVNISSISYAGISIASCANGEIARGSISSITMPSPLTNAYGVAVSRRSSSSGELATYPRSSNVTVRDLTITGVPWEGLDTHGGSQIQFLNNTFYGCMVGVAAVASSNNTGTSTYAPLGVMISGNKIYGNVTDGSLANGIQFVGCAAQQGTGMILGNTIEDMGKDNASNGLGAIYIEQTSALVAAQNVAKRPGGAGILVGPSNNSLGLFNNTIEDVWAVASAICTAVYVKSGPNTVTIGGTKIARGSKTATLVNNEGLRCNASSTHIDAGGNDWTLATTPVVGGASVLKASAYGAAPVARAAAITSPTAPSASYVQAEAAAMKTSVDAIIAALKNYGITL